MKAMMLGACLAATLGLPALAQPGDGYQDQPDPYYDQPPPPQTQPPQPAPSSDEGGYQSDQGYGQYQPPPRPPPGEPGFQVYQSGPSYGLYPDVRTYQPAPQWRAYRSARYTGRVGRAWRNPEGQVCAWRQLTWQDVYGRQAYQWVPRCRDD